jgi:hypothetical protein
VAGSGGPRGRGRKWLWRGLLVLVAAVVVPELCLRAILFRDLPGCDRLEAELRDAPSYFQRFEEGYWTSLVRFSEKARKDPIPGYDPVLGWRSRLIEAQSFAHPDEPKLGDRRPVLLYGDSFAQCLTRPRACWQGLMERSALRSTHGLLNYGVGGFGIDQTYLMLRSSLGRFAEREPIVIVSVMLDDDLDRAVLPFRCWPKPRFHLEDGRLVEPEPVEEGVEAYLERHPAGVVSWLWRLLIYRGPLPDGLAPDAEAHDREVRALARALFEAMQAELAGRATPWFVLVFQGESVFRDEDPPWQDAFLTDLLRELEIPFVHSARELRGHQQETGTPAEDYFGIAGHYGPLGNEVVFGTLLRGLRGEFD